MGKHAYLIIAHNEFQLLKILLQMLDYDENDIYLHIDKKVGNFNESLYCNLVHRSDLIFITPRIDIKWGDYSQIQCELMLLKASIQKKYQYYHLMSGVDLPLKTQEYIHQFFDKNNGTEFIQFANHKLNKETFERVSKYHFFAKREKKVGEKILDKLLIMSQIFVDRTRNSNLIYQKGANWFSITHNLATYILSKERVIKKYFKYTICGDEMFIQTLVASSNFIKSITANNYCDNYENICYCIDWDRGSPYIFRKEDFDFLVSSNQLFARKFSWEIDHVIINKIYEFVCD